VLNNLDRFQLAFDAIRRIARLHSIVDRESDRLQDSHQRHKAFVMQNGEDMPEVRDWKWKA
jgi:xylulose-5-phosphate/fructose-6-phosphate phosphoketolase